MHKFKQLRKTIGNRGALALLLAATLLSSGCYYNDAQRDYTKSVPEVPWWCQGLNGDPDLTQQQCLDFSFALDVATVDAYKFYPTVADIVGAGGVLIADRPANIGLAYTRGPIPTTFELYVPNVYLYGGATNGNRLVGVAWSIDSETAPEGFPGNRDVWTQDPTTGDWWLTAWIIRGHQNQPNVFASSHPCLTNTDTTLTSTTDACYIAAHPAPFEVLVTNDDGYQAEGIDAIVEGLYGLPNMDIHVVAPLANQSGSGDSTTPAPYSVGAINDFTLSGRPAVAVTSTDPADPFGSGSPADSVLYGLRTLKLSPDLVISGTNEGQNMATIGAGASGTIGAARTALRNGATAIATSTGFGATVDFDAGTFHTLALIERWRLGLEKYTASTVLNINIPSCTAPDTINGTVYTIVADSLAGRNYGLQDCSSTKLAGDIFDDIDAFNNGYVGITDMGGYKPPNFP